MKREVIVCNCFLESTKNFSMTNRGKILDFIRKLNENHLRSGIHIEHVEKSISPDIRSARVSQSIRAILLERSNKYYLLHVNKHDDAYNWIKHRKIDWDEETHCVRMSLVLQDQASEATHSSAKRTTTAPLFAGHSEVELTNLNFPAELVPEIKKITNLDQIDELERRFPEYGDSWVRLLGLVDGRPLPPPRPKLKQTILWSIKDDEPDFLPPNQEWLRDLTPGQRELVLGEFNGPVRITGMAGTGKTVVALYRAAFLAKNGKSVLLTTFTRSLCQFLSKQLKRLCSKEESERIKIVNVYSLARELYNKYKNPNYNPCDLEDEKKYISTTISECENRGIKTSFAEDEWEKVIVRKGIDNLQDYLNEPRHGRGIPLRSHEREMYWKVYESVFKKLREDGKIAWFQVCKEVTNELLNSQGSILYDAVIVDEFQDLGKQELLMLYTLCKGHEANFMLVGDAEQEIYNQGGVNLRELGIETRGRSHKLLYSYRMTGAIRLFAEQILGNKQQNTDSESFQSPPEDWEGSSQFGSSPTLHPFSSEEEQAQFLIKSVQSIQNDGVDLSDVAIFVPTNAKVEYLCGKLKKAEINYYRLKEKAKNKEKTKNSKSKNSEIEDTTGDGLAVDTMYQAKGWEFRIVFLAYCNDGYLPNYAEWNKTDERDHPAVERRYRRLLYTAITRAKEKLYVSWVGKPSRLLPTDSALRQ